MTYVFYRTPQVSKTQCTYKTRFPITLKFMVRFAKGSKSFKINLIYRSQVADLQKRANVQPTVPMVEDQDDLQGEASADAVAAEFDESVWPYWPQNKGSLNRLVTLLGFAELGDWTSFHHIAQACKGNAMRRLIAKFKNRVYKYGGGC